MMDPNMHGGGGGWSCVPWLVLVAALALVGLFFWYRSRSRGGSEGAFTYLFDGMGSVHITRTHTDTQGVEHPVAKETADRAAHRFFEVYERTWRECTKVYGWGRQHWPIETVAVVDGIVHKAHPHVMWNAPLPRVWVRLQVGMLRWFALEVHNIFRYHLHGMNHIYKTIDSRDKMRAQEMVAWIERRYGGTDE